MLPQIDCPLHLLPSQFEISNDENMGLYAAAMQFPVSEELEPEKQCIQQSGISLGWAAYPGKSDRYCQHVSSR